MCKALHQESDNGFKCEELFAPTKNSKAPTGAAAAAAYNFVHEQDKLPDIGLIASARRCRQPSSQLRQGINVIEQNLRCEGQCELHLVNSEYMQYAATFGLIY